VALIGCPHQSGHAVVTTPVVSVVYCIHVNARHGEEPPDACGVATLSSFNQSLTRIVEYNERLSRIWFSSKPLAVSYPYLPERFSAEATTIQTKALITRNVLHTDGVIFSVTVSISKSETGFDRAKFTTTKIFVIYFLSFFR
jgi:hypothetical protein